MCVHMNVFASMDTCEQMFVHICIGRLMVGTIPGGFPPYSNKAGLSVKPRAHRHG